jgi:DNA-binding transcriptional regulator of glucitol operon
LWTPAWLVRHAVALALVVAFLALGWWQVTRAASGNVLSYAYAVEWPLFAGFVVFVWAKEVRRARAASVASADRADGGPAATDAAPPPLRSTRPARVGPGWDHEDDEQLVAYNRYLAWLAANPTARPADYREG